MREWPISKVARATGLTSRTLRHYEQIGLLQPHRAADNGYRFYGPQEIARLYRILSLRALGIPLETIRQVVADECELEQAVKIRVELLREQQLQIAHQLSTAQQVLETIQQEQIVDIEQLFAGFDNSQYEAEVRSRWGDDAWERSAERLEKLDEAAVQAESKRTIDITAALRSAAESGLDVASQPFQSLIADHYAWVTDWWGGKAPTREEYAGLAQMYVADLRFAATYGGQQNAELIHQAISIWIDQNLPA